MSTEIDKRALIGSSLRRFRLAREISQEELAERLRVSRQHISELENDKAVPALDELVRLADALDVAPAAFLPRDPGQRGEGWETLSRRLHLTYDDALTLRTLLEATGVAETSSVQEALLIWMRHKGVIQ